MPILVKCPSCPTKLNAPDASAGKRVKCPKCGETIPVPEAESDFEVVDDEPAPPRPAKPVVARRREVDDDEDDRPRAKSRRRDEEDDEDDRPRKRKRDEDEDDEDDRPRKKKGGDKKKGPPIVLLAAIGGGVALLAIVATVLFLVFGGKPTGPGGILGSSAPAGYTAVREPAGGFAVFLPGTASKVDVKINDKPGAELGHFGWASFSGGSDQQVWAWSRSIPAGFNPGTDPDGMQKLLAVYKHYVQSANQQYEQVSKKAVTLGGKPGAEIKVKQKPFLMGKPGDNGFFAERDREETERVARDGEHHVFYVTHNGKQVFIIHLSQKKGFPTDDVLKIIADSFTLI